MARKRVILPEEDIAPLRDQFLAWRSRRSGREPIPAHLWEGAVALAQVHGLCPVARAFGLDYASLKAKLGGVSGRPCLVQPAFLEIQASRSFPPGAGAAIEISAPNGARMAIQLQPGQGQEAASIVAAFLGSHG